MTIGEKILELRKSKKKSQKELASVLGVERSAISLWETDKVVPSGTNLNKLLAFFDVPISYLFGHPEIPAPDDEMNGERALMMALLKTTAILSAEVKALKKRLKIKERKAEIPHEEERQLIERRAIEALQGITGLRFPFP